MSKEENTKFIEGLYQRISDLDGITVGSVQDFERYIAENDLEGAKALVESLEAYHADDL